MTPQDTAAVVSAIVTQAVNGRILGVGAQQYDDGGTQRFEQLPLPALVAEFLAEIDDGIAYLAFLRIRADRLVELAGELAEQ